MPQRKPNQIARVLAVLALIGAFALVVAVIVTNGDGESDEDGTEQTEQTGLTKSGERALERGVWIVEDGDTLVAISEQTGIDLDELVSLNPDIDPQALIAGQRISLRAGDAGDDSSSSSSDSSGTTTNDDPADEFGDGSVGDSNSDSTSTTP